MGPFYTIYQAEFAAQQARNAVPDIWRIYTGRLVFQDASNRFFSTYSSRAKLFQSVPMIGHGLREVRAAFED